MRKLNVTELGRIDVEQFKNSRKLPLTIILDDVRSLYNVGSVFRTSDAFRVERIILCGITATPEDSVKLDNLVVDKTRRYALVLGNEVKGVSQDVVDICNFSLEIPQYGTKHSLNVSVSAGLVIWEFARQLKDLF